MVRNTKSATLSDWWVDWMAVRYPNGVTGSCAVVKRMGQKKKKCKKKTNVPTEYCYHLCNGGVYSRTA